MRSYYLYTKRHGRAPGTKGGTGRLSRIKAVLSMSWIIETLCGESLETSKWFCRFWVTREALTGALLSFYLLKCNVDVKFYTGLDSATWSAGLS